MTVYANLVFSPHRKQIAAPASSAEPEPRMMEMAKHKAMVVKKYASGRFEGLFVEITASGDYSDTPTVIAAVPCETEDQAWAVCDAFNHPESNANDWRIGPCSEPKTFEDALFGEVSQETIDIMDRHFSAA
ncbi:hypothetical protein RJJ65_32280 [Rhizobium hidalgonense]|uniref:Uncharacterized protein n=1 Tax=Rhizobium hidalgonense TaxID=1538159 RepID=A0AAJ2H155_9HYPH|nr:hypothetical protein [Rhizobium hidalgonense]MDR9777237.1 hypothetical protein [Rhizobium hidalgonense]